MNAYLLHSDALPPDPAVEEVLRQECVDVERVDLPAHHEHTAKLFEGKESGIVLLPALWEDLFAVKLIEEIVALDTPFETLIVGQAPEASTLILAFNEGLAAYVEAPWEGERLKRAIARAAARLRYKNKLTGALRALERYEAGGEAKPAAMGAVERLRAQCLGLAFVDCINRTGPLFDGSIRALLVSSSRPQQKQMEALLHRVGFTVDIASARAEASRMAKATPYTLLISDNVLPDGDAIALAADLRAMHVTPFPRFIVWSSSPEKAEALLRPGSNIDEVIAKPLGAAGLESALPAIIACLYQGRA